MINNDVLLFSATNEETPYEQLLRGKSGGSGEGGVVRRVGASKLMNLAVRRMLRLKDFVQQPTN